MLREPSRARAIGKEKRRHVGTARSPLYPGAGDAYGKFTDTFVVRFLAVALPLARVTRFLAAARADI